MRRTLPILVVVLAVLPFLGSIANGFVSLDDPQYVTDSPWVQRGLSLSGLRWALLSFDASNWHPLTWWTYMLDHQLAGLDARVYHLQNVLWHGLAALFVFLFARRLLRVWSGAANDDVTVDLGAAAAALLFAWHPLRVESVAWISERKDVVSGAFFAASLYAYLRYVERPRATPMVVVVLALSLGLAAKAMLMTVPLVLLMLDVWPLQRLGRRAVQEKLGLFAVAAVVAGLALAAQQTASSSLEALPLPTRLVNATVALARYASKTMWPADLNVLYAYPASYPTSRWLLAGVVVAALVVLAVRVRRSRPWWTLALAWALLMLAPVLGLVQVGVASMADRYTYAATVGVALAVGVEVTLALRGRARVVVTVVVCAVLVALASATVAQVPVWHDSRALFEHAIANEPDNGPAHAGLARVLLSAGDRSLALEHARRAVELRPDQPANHALLGSTLAATGQHRAAIDELALALGADANEGQWHLLLAYSLVSVGEHDAAVAETQRALELGAAGGAMLAGIIEQLTRLGRADDVARLRARANHTVAP